MEKDTETLAGPLVTRAAKEIADMSAGNAEKAIEAIADRDGDELVKEILARLPPVKIAAILRRHDFSCPSIISGIMTPEIIGEVLKVDPLFWRHVYNRKDSGNFLKIQDDALDLITSILTNVKSRDQQEAILQRIITEELSLLYLFLPFIGWEIKEEQTLYFEDSEIDFGAADHLFEMIRWAAPDVAKQIFDLVYSGETSLVYYITDVWLEAFQCFQQGHDFSSVENVMFLPID